MKTVKDIKKKIAELDSARINAINDRENGKTETDRAVAHNLVLVYAMQSSILEWVIEDEKTKEGDPS